MDSASMSEELPQVSQDPEVSEVSEVVQVIEIPETPATPERAEAPPPVAEVTEVIQTPEIPEGSNGPGGPRDIHSADGDDGPEGLDSTNSPNYPEIAEAPESPEAHEISKTPQFIELPASRPASSHTSPLMPNLAVQVTITFDEPLNYTYSRNYETSSSLQATEDLYEGLLRRVDHCCHELITRKDTTAMEYAAASGPDKPLRYEIQIDILRDWTEIWASRTFKSYQKQPLSAEAAKEIIMSTQYIIGLFLRHHDEGFVWKDDAVRDDPLDEQGKFSHRAGRVEPMSCVPRSFFLEKTQSFESIPGYTINFSFTSRCQRRKPSEWYTTVEVNSNQTTPLNSLGAEALFFEASYAVEGVLRSERQAFEVTHRQCANLDGCKDCRHHESDGLELKFAIANNLGPQFPRLERTIHCNSNLSFYSDIQECLSFVNKVENALSSVRDDTDDIIDRMDDLEFKITELRGHGWSLDEPLVFTLDSSKSYSRRNIEAILDRIQAGVADTLRGNAISVRMTAHKRGHFILDKTFVAREPIELSDSQKMKKSSKKPKAYVLDRLRRRVECDIDMICKDTLTLDNIGDEAANAQKGPHVLERTRSNESVGARTFVTRPKTAESASRYTTEGSRYPSPRPKTSAGTSVSRITVESKRPATADAKTTENEVRLYSPTSRPPIPVRRSSLSLAIVYPDGTRAFPLVPGFDHHAESESPSLDKDFYKGSSLQDPFISDQPTSEIPLQPRQNSCVNTNESLENVPATTNLEEELGSQRVYEASIASTPSLVSGDGSSPSSSFCKCSLFFFFLLSSRQNLILNLVVITPKPHHLNQDVDYSTSAIVDSDDEDAHHMETDLAKISSTFPSPKLRHAAKPLTSSPLRMSQSTQEQSSVDSLETSNPPTTNGIVELTISTFGSKEQTPAIPAIEIHLLDDSTLVSPKVNVDLNTNEGAIIIQSSEEIITPSPKDKVAVTSEDDYPLADDFAQSKPDITFSPTTSGSSEAEDTCSAPVSPSPQQQKQLILATPVSPDPSDTEDNNDYDDDAGTTYTLSPPLLPQRPQQQRGSFGSAGVLGFHEQMFGSLSLRSALMRSRTHADFKNVKNVKQEEKRPGTAV